MQSSRQHKTTSLALALAAVASWQLQPQGSAAAFFHGATFGAGQFGNPHNRLNDSASVSSLQMLAAAGANSVAIPIVWYQNATNSTEVFPMSGDSGSPLRTVEDFELEAIVQTAHSLNLTTAFQLVVDLNWDRPENLRSFDPLYPGAECLLYDVKQSLGMPVPPHPPTCPDQATSREYIGCASAQNCESSFTSEQWRSWFASYGAFVDNYAKLAEKLDVDILGVAYGLTHASRAPNASEWEDVVAAAKASFTGKITATAKVTSSENIVDELDVITWRDSLDFVGVDLEIPLNVSDATTESLVEAWQPSVNSLKEFSKEAEVPLIISRWGYQSRISAWEFPQGAPRDGNGSDCSVYMRCSSMQDQETAYDAFFDAFAADDGDTSTDWLAGAFMWLWRNDPSQGGTSGDDYTPVGKPAFDILRRAWGSKTEGALSFDSQFNSMASRSAPDSITSQERKHSRNLYKGKQNGICFGIGEWSSTESPSANLNSSEARQSLRDAAAVGVNR